MLQRLGRPAAWWLITTLLVVSGATRGLDRTAHDGLQRLRGARHTAEGVILVTIDAESLGALGPLPWSWEVLGRLITPVLEADPPAIGLLPYPDQLFPATEVPKGPLADAIAEGRVVLSSRLQSSPLGELPTTTRGLPDSPAGDLLRGAEAGVRALRTDPGGRVRRQALHHRTTAGEQAALEAVLLVAAGIELPPRRDEVGISYVGPPGEIARVSAIKVLRGEIPRGSFAHRVVLLGLTAAGIAPVHATPVSTGPELMAAAEVHANVLATVLDGRHVREWGWLGVLLLAPLILLTDLLVRRVDLGLAALRGGAVLAVCLVAFAAASAWLDLRLPLAAGALACVGPVALEASARASRTRRRVQQLLVDLSQSPTFRTGGGGARGGEQFWNYLAGFLAQFTGIDRVVVGERTGGKHLYEWRGAHDVELAEVDLAPSALRKLRLQRTLLEGRPAVVSGAAWSGHDDLLALPLGSGDEIHAMALLVVPNAGQVLRGEGARLVAAGAVGGRMLEQRRSAQVAMWSSLPRAKRSEHRRRGGGLAGPFHRVGIDHQVDIAGVLTRLVLDDRVQFRGILQSLPVGATFADMMGEVQLINEAARRILETSGCRYTAGANLPTLVGDLTHRPVEEISAALFAAYRTNEPTVFHWETRGAASHTYRMQVQLVSESPGGGGEDRGAATARPAPLGYLCVLDDVTATRETQKGMLTVLEALTQRAESHLASLHRVGRLVLSQSDLPLESAGLVSQMLAQADSLVSLIEEFATTLGPTDGSETGVIPVDPCEFVSAAVEEVGAALGDGERLEIVATGPVTPVLMDRTRIARALNRILFDSLINSPAEAVTVVDVKEERTRVILEVRDEGYGIPVAVLDQLDTDQEGALDPADGLARVARDVRDGGGRLTIESRVGHGTTYDLVFSKRVKVSDLPTGPGEDDS